MSIIHPFSRHHRLLHINFPSEKYEIWEFVKENFNSCESSSSISDFHYATNHCNYAPWWWLSIIIVIVSKYVAFKEHIQLEKWLLSSEIVAKHHHLHLLHYQPRKWSELKCVFFMLFRKTCHIKNFLWEWEEWGSIISTHSRALPRPENLNTGSSGAGNGMK